MDNITMIKWITGSQLTCHKLELVVQDLKS